MVFDAFVIVPAQGATPGLELANYIKTSTHGKVNNKRGASETRSENAPIPLATLKA
jgi:hypothetical protein